jgi:hypothetical protein
MYASPTRLLGYDLSSDNMFNVLSYFTDANRFAARTLNIALIAGTDLALLFYQFGVANGAHSSMGSRSGLPLLYYVFFHATRNAYLAWINMGANIVAQDLTNAIANTVSYQAAVNGAVTAANVRIALTNVNLSAEFRAVAFMFVNTNQGLAPLTNVCFTKWGAVPA